MFSLFLYQDAPFALNFPTLLSHFVFFFSIQTDGKIDGIASHVQV
jgi:uncharacterized protein Usg